MRVKTSLVSICKGVIFKAIRLWQIHQITISLLLKFLFFCYVSERQLKILKPIVKLMSYVSEL